MGRSFKQLVAVLKSPYRIFKAFDDRHMLDWLPDEPYLKLAFRLKMGYKLDLKDPKTFNEKLQWLKLHDRDPLYTTLVDKYAVRAWVAERIGEEYIVPLVGGPWDSAEDIDFDALPEQFVLKCTHDSGSVVVCRDKAQFDCGKAVEKLALAMKSNYYISAREWPYKNVKPRIIAEKYIADENGALPDYKLFCFNGQMRLMYIATDREKGANDTRLDFFGRDLKHLPFEQAHPNQSYAVEMPKHIEKMISLSETLSDGIPQARIDFYEVNGKLYFGEVTLFHFGGMEAFHPREWDYTIGSWLELPNMEK